MYKVSGLLFEDETTAEQARKEVEGIRYIRERSSLSNPQSVLKLYKTLLEQKLFMTPVGLGFLLELQEILHDATDVDVEEIPAIDTTAFLTSVPVIKDEGEPLRRKEQESKAIAAEKKKTQQYKHAFHVSAFFAVVFGLSVLGMFLIMELSGNSTTILNYREKIINEYEVWEQELKAEEERLKEWAEELELQAGE